MSHSHVGPRFLAFAISGRVGRAGRGERRLVRDPQGAPGGTRHLRRVLHAGAMRNVVSVGWPARVRERVELEYHQCRGCCRGLAPAVVRHRERKPSGRSG
eukprot:3780879-Pleurochrysis_carterae.AAC.1